MTAQKSGAKMSGLRKQYFMHLFGISATLSQR